MHGCPLCAEVSELFRLVGCHDPDDRGTLSAFIVQAIVACPKVAVPETSDVTGGPLGYNNSGGST